MSRKQKTHKELHRLQSSLTAIAALLDQIEGRPHSVLRTSAEQLTRKAVANPNASLAKPQPTLADYTRHFATTLAKSGVSLKD